MALVGVGIGGALLIPLAAMAYIFTHKRPAFDDESPQADDATAKDGAPVRLENTASEPPNVLAGREPDSLGSIKIRDAWE